MLQLNKWKQIILLTLPSFFSFATQTVTGSINLIMVGHLGFLTIAVVGVSNIIMYNVFALFSGIGHTVSYLVAQNFGANEMRKGIQRMYLALLASAGIAVLIVLAGLFGSGAVLRLTGGSADLVAAGGDYLKLRFYAQAFGIISFVFHGFFRGIGHTRTSMILSMIGNGTMLILTYALTNGAWGLPNLGLRGAGIAILIGEALQLLCCAFVYWGPMHRRFSTRTLPKPDWSELRLVAQESGKLGLQEFAMSVSMYIFTMFVARLGDAALAANEVALNVMSFGFMPAFAFGSTATILVGQAIGRGQSHEGKRAGTDTAIMGAVFLLLLGTAEMIWSVPIGRVYSNDPAVFLAAAHLIQLSAFLQLFDGMYNFYAGGLRGIGDTTFLMRSSMVLNFCLFIPLAYLFVVVFHWGGTGAWLSLYTFLTALGVTVTIRFYRTDWNAVRLKEAIV
ncbi:MATE family efflux transporter [Cohnella zeiphila]|uniref:Probable multidrug resistance protein NorM n=1 Tax=Cohnella zeiphila TaxID=2761120 RepID=A0A7X0ST44_9BACL|nr:MATE family efflux transporter [Cohnella zeiphila]MBB6735632.1 MATE family efflux transporter [Cohnella zeiphila]